MSGAIPDATIAFLAISTAIAFGLPIGLLAYYRLRHRIALIVAGSGAAVWLAFALGLEGALHTVVLPLIDPGSQPFVFGAYGALAAGVFEEVGRYVALSFFLKTRRQWKDGMAFGIGHGGAESIVIAALPFSQLLVLAMMINSGTFAQVEGLLPEEASSAIRQSLPATDPYLFLVGGMERVFAISVHIALSMVVLYGLATGKGIRFLLIAIAFHAGVDFLPALYQAGVVDLALTEAMVGVFAGASLFVIYLARKKWPASSAAAP
ncbi:YhfC family glutamic-type intramembrane protease [Nitrososphaera sp.]|uniref:YhfC family intramembrane metalloprotease n=1 Tax=Nitrososphaera sp. TaxID=1971748 RepID=UPI001817E1A8|nr:YhfC family glutamic-type intramembrane protease [Nitrososphaera sp.]NWG37491.1 YhfC family intramembrane metalloprotease [Nitrososphaera sp.]